MSNNVNERIEKLYQAVSKEEKNFTSSLNKALGFYLVIIIILASYTVFLNIKIKELATPTNLAIALNTKIKDAIPMFTRKIKEQMKPGAKQLADKTIESVHALIPKSTEFVKSQIEFYVNDVMTQIENKHLVELQNIFESTVDEAMKNKDIVQDKTLGKLLATQITAKIDDELKNVINNEMLDSIDKLRNDIESLRSKPVKLMTKNEYAERSFLVYWLYLVNNTKTGESNFADVLNIMTRASENFCNKASNIVADIEVNAATDAATAAPKTKKPAVQ
ncbi:MAG: hypothetical protein WCV67_02510 [Victivallaceae bacterium]|jgi:hypothetical protein